MLVVITVTLPYFKTELQGITQNLGRRDLISILQFAVLSCIILPILPNQNYGPFDALKLYQIWLIMVLISGMSLTGYIALRFVEQRYGVIFLGVMGGPVSSTTQTLEFTRRSSQNLDLLKYTFI